MSATATFLSKCPRCHGMSLVEDAYGTVDECVVCGYFAGENFQCDLPHFGYAYRFPGAANPKDIPEIQEEPGANLAAIETWLKAHEEIGFEFPRVVLVDTESKIHWLRGSPSPWDASGQ